MVPLMLGNPHITLIKRDFFGGWVGEPMTKSKVDRAQHWTGRYMCIEFKVQGLGFGVWGLVYFKCKGDIKVREGFKSPQQPGCCSDA